jgi:AcrR family transcriptional regulator
VAEERRERTRSSIVEVAARLLRDEGAAAVTTRAVAQAAGMQAPTIYRFFEDKEALLDAVAEHVLATYVSSKEVAAGDADPVADLRAGWHAHISFGLANAALFGLLTDPARGGRSPAAEAGLEVLRARVHRVAGTGRLRVPEARAVALIHAAGVGTVLTLLSSAPSERDPGLADAMYDSVLRTILADAPPLPAADPRSSVDAFVAVAPTLTPAERALLGEWLSRPPPP